MLLDFVADAARSALKLLGGAEREVEQHSPIEQPAHEAIAALHRAADSMDRHVEVLEGVAATLPALTGALVKLTEQLGEALRLAAPLEAAEREVAGIGHLFRRHRHQAPMAALTTPAALAAIAPGAGDGSAPFAPTADADVEAPAGDDRAQSSDTAAP
jgi:ABC-type transporter Mla subunit MlaD